MESKPLNQRAVRYLLWLTVPLLTVALFALTSVISSASYHLAERCAASLMRLDPDQSYLVISIHHVFQAIAALLVIVLLSLVFRKKLTAFGFNKNELRFSMRSVLLFCAIWFVIQFVLTYVLTKYFGLNGSFPYPLTTRNVIGNFLFEILLSGTSEEILFRAMVIPPMIFVFRTFIKKESSAKIIAVVCSTLIFTLAHVGYTLDPFSITTLVPAQLATCVLFGTFYGWLLVRTKSIIGPMLAHNLLNGVITISTLLITILFQ